MATITPLYLTDDQVKQINDIYARIVKKYTSYAGDTVTLSAVCAITMEDAKTLAVIELESKHAQILAAYEEEVRQINVNAAKRGLQISSVVLAQLDRAQLRKNDALQRLDGQTNKLASKIFADNQKLCLAVEREKSNSKSRSLRDFIAVSRMKNSVPFDAQSMIDEELYNAYMEWLLMFKPDTASRYVQSNACFMHNLNSATYTRLVNEVKRRNGGV